MKLLTYAAEGRTRYGALDGEEVVDLAARLRQPTLAALLASDGLGAAAAALRAPGPRHALTDVEILAPLPEARLFCVGANYPKPHPLGGVVKGPANISFFIKHQAALVPHGAALQPPEVSEQFDYEAELTVVIGRGGRRIAPEEALTHVAGYTIMNDGSVRDWQAHSVAAGKNFCQSGAWGPWITTSDEVTDWKELRLMTRLNGRTVQDSKAGAMFFGIPALIAYLSTITPLLPGDVIATGSPEGTGATQSPPRFLRRGDALEIEIAGIGVLANRVG